MSPSCPTSYQSKTDYCTYKTHQKIKHGQKRSRKVQLRF
uniref:Uncharacterized protein n=1 Tax=Rhizophora mucronata TaxID=61149 RepID=A0A2P2IT09_RHIMU